MVASLLSRKCFIFKNKGFRDSAGNRIFIQWLPISLCEAVAAHCSSSRRLFFFRFKRKKHALSIPVLQQLSKNHWVIPLFIWSTQMTRFKGRVYTGHLNGIVILTGFSKGYTSKLRKLTAYWKCGVLLFPWTPSEGRGEVVKNLLCMAKFYADSWANAWSLMNNSCEKWLEYLNQCRAVGLHWGISGFSSCQVLGGKWQNTATISVIEQELRKF